MQSDQTYAFVFNRTFRTIALAVIFGSLAYYLTEIDAFELFYYYSRDHEEWELDEFAISGVSVLFFTAIWLALNAKDQAVKAQR